MRASISDLSAIEQRCPVHTTLLQNDQQTSKQLHTIMYKKLP